MTMKSLFDMFTSDVNHVGGSSKCNNSLNDAHAQYMEIGVGTLNMIH